MTVTVTIFEYIAVQFVVIAIVFAVIYLYEKYKALRNIESKISELEEKLKNKISQ